MFYLPFLTGVSVFKLVFVISFDSLIQTFTTRTNIVYMGFFSTFKCTDNILHVC